MKRFNNYLLTHYPLLWNTRVVWVLLTNLILHFLFFLGGLGSVTAKTLKDYYSIGRVGGESLYIFSILCALLVVIVWCIFYLRNNAFKSFYRLSKFYLAKEFAIIFLVILTTISYAQSFEWGVKLRVRSITNEKEFVQETTAVNKGMVYVPVTKADYFLLNNCTEKAKRTTERGTDITPPELGQYYGGADSLEVKKALAQPNAFSYANYCHKAVAYNAYASETAETISARNKGWLSSQQRDSVKQSIEKLFTVLNKYGIDYRLNEDSLVNAVFKDSLSTLSNFIATQHYSYQYGEQENKYYLTESDVQRVFELVEYCQPGANTWRDIETAWNVIGYISLFLSVLLLCYRRFSRKVFLISVVGTLVWMILVGLVAAGSHDAESILYFLLILCAAFLLIAFGLLNSRSSKTTTGVLLNWHVYLAPFAVMLVVFIIDSYRSHTASQYYSSRIDVEAFMRQNYPFSTWVVAHEANIFLVNILMVACYVAFVFNGLAKRWHLLPEE